MSVVRLIQGDCLDILPTLAPQSVDAIITDLPYGTTACKWDEVIPFAPMWEQVKRVLKPRGVFVTTASQPFTSRLITSNLEWFKYCWTWDKVLAVGHLVAKKRPLQQTEDIVVFGSGGINYSPIMTKRDAPRHIKKGIGQGNTVHLGHEQKTHYETVLHDRYPTTILRFSNAAREGLHPTQKPVALYAYLIRTYTNPGDTVLDFTCGSGTTGVAAINTGRNFIGIEKDSNYFEIAKKRITETQAQPALLVTA